MRTAVIVGAAAALVAGGLGSWTMANAESGYLVTFDAHGGVCTGGMEITVPPGGSYTVPTEGTGTFQCHRPLYRLAGWSHGHVLGLPGEQARVPVVAAGQSATVVEHTTLRAVWIPQGVEIIYDANVHEDDECLDHSGNNVPVEERTSPAILHKADHRIAHHAPCTPPGYELQGWVLKTDRGAAARSGSLLQGRDLREDSSGEPLPSLSIEPSPSAEPPTPPPTQGPDPTPPPPPAAPTVAPGSQVSDSGLDSGTTPTLVANWGPGHHIPVPTSDPTTKPTIDPVIPTSTPTPLPTSTPTPIATPSGDHCDLPPAPYVDWHGCDKSGANLENVLLHGANLSGGNFSNAQLWSADLSSVKASGANFSDADFTAGANLADADLSSGDYRFAALNGARNFASANISGSNFGDAYWSDSGACDPDSPLGECTINGEPQSR